VNGVCVNKPKDCDDGLMCTSADGIHIGPDQCIEGTCFQKKIEDRDKGVGKYEFDPKGLLDVLRASKLYA